MTQIPDIFLDTSALFSGIWSTTGGARMLLKLGEAQAINLCVSSQVLTEIEGALRRKAPQQLGVLAFMLDRSQIQLRYPASAERLAMCQTIIQYEPDAIVLAAAWQAEIDYFVTLDRQHFLNNAQLHDDAPFEIGTPGDCLAWYRDRWR